MCPAVSGTVDEITPGGDLAELLDALPIQTRFAEHELEAVLVGRVVRAGHHDRTVEVEVMHGEIQHRGRAAANADYFEAASNQPFHQRGLECRRADRTSKRLNSRH